MSVQQQDEKIRASPDLTMNELVGLEILGLREGRMSLTRHFLRSACLGATSLDTGETDGEG